MVMKAPRDPQEAVMMKKMLDLWIKFLPTAAALRPLLISR